MKLDQQYCYRTNTENFRTLEEWVLFLRHLYAYEFACTRIQPTHLVLEVGCGEGYGVASLAARARSIVALDISADVLEHARETHPEPNCSFLHYDGVLLPFPDKTFDLLVSFQVIEHVDDVPAFLRETRRVCRQGAELIFTTPNRCLRLGPEERPWNRYHLREYSASELQKEMRQIFPSSQILGVSGTPRIKAVELERIKRHRTVRTSKFSGAISRLREAFAALVPLGHKSRRATVQSDAPFKSHDEFSLMDFFVTDSELDESLDLLALCSAGE